MTSFPKIQKAKLFDCFDKITNLYSKDKQIIIDAAQRAAMNISTQIRHNTTSTVDQKINAIKTKIGVTGDKEGQTFFINLIEELYNDIASTSVTPNDFLEQIKIEFEDHSVIQFNSNKLWDCTFTLNIDDDQDFIKLKIRGATLHSSEIIPEYIFNNLQQSIIAFESGKNAAALSLLSISLEGALRDALVKKGYNYQPGTPRNDVYKKEKIHIYKDPDGYKIKFPNAMPLPHSNFLSTSTNLYLEYKIKRTQVNGNWILQLSEVDNLLDYFSQNQVVTQGQVNIEGLGTALDIARNTENIIDEGIFPLDFDKPIKAIRNNLIHLSGDAMEREVYTIGTRNLKLKEFINSKERVFDTICSISGIVDDLYYKISTNTL